MAHDSWTETALITLNIEGVTGDFQMSCLTETLNIDGGEAGVDFIKNLCGGRIPKFSPEEPTTVSIEGYPLQVSAAEGADDDVEGVLNFLYGPATVSDGTMTLVSARNRRKIRFIVRWTTETGVNAEDALAADEQNLRFVMVAGYATSIKHEFTDDILKVSMELKFAPYDKSGEENYQFESTDGTGTSPASDLSALAAYTSINKF